MSWRPNYSFGGAPYGGGGNYDERYDNNGEDYYHSSRSRRSSEDDYRRSRSRCDDDHNDRRRRSRDNYHRRRRSSSSSNDFSMELSTTNIDVPLTQSGKQKSPNQIRNELQRYIDQCKADGTSNQTRIIEQMG